MKTIERLCMILAMLSVLGQAAVAQTVSNTSLLGNYGKSSGIVGPSKAVFAAGSLVYYGLGSTVQIASFSNPATPVNIASVTFPVPPTLEIEDLVRTSIGGNQHLVVTGGAYMWLINVQNPTTPSVVATVQIPGATCEGIATSGTYAYVAAGGAGLQIYNIATPASPALVASMDSLAYCEAVVISGQYAYIAAGTRSHIVDISNPAAPLYVGRIAGYGEYHQSINVRSGYVYICRYSVGVSVVNVTNPASPLNVMEVPAGDRMAKIVFDGNYAYVAIGDLGMKIFNVVNPAAPVFVSTTQTAGRSRSLSYGAITINGTPTGHIFVANSHSAIGISAINVSNPATPTTSSFLGAPTSGEAFGALYDNNKVYVANGGAGLRILDVSSPGKPTLLGELNTPGEARSVVLRGGFAYVADLDAGVRVINVSNPAAPVEIRGISTSRARGIAVNGNYVYVATRDSGLVVLDATDPANPTWLTSVRGIDVENVAATGNVVAISLYTKIRLYNMTNPAVPVAGGETATLTTGNEGLAVAGNYAYIPDADTLRIYNISNIASPVQVGKVWAGGYGYAPAISGNYAYVPADDRGLRVINVANPAAPVLAGFYDGNPLARGVAADGGFAYVAERTDGLTVYRNDLAVSVEQTGALPSAFGLHQNYPNPFNPATSIAFDLAERASVTLEVFSVLGQRVAVLLNRQMQAGSFTVSFDASGLPSGMYLYRLQAGSLSSVRKMLLLK